MSVAFSEASSSRIEAARQSGIANAALQADLTIWGVYLQARAQGDTALTTYVENASQTTSGWPTELGLRRANRQPVRSG